MAHGQRPDLRGVQTPLTAVTTNKTAKKVRRPVSRTALKIKKNMQDELILLRISLMLDAARAQNEYKEIDCRKQDTRSAEQ